MLLHHESSVTLSLCRVQVAETSTFTYVWSAPGDDCSGYRGDVESALELYGLLGNLTFRNHGQEIARLEGSHNLSQPVTDMLDNTVGECCLCLANIRACQGRLRSSLWTGQA